MKGMFKGAILLGAVAAATPCAAEIVPERWNVSPFVGGYTFEGDQNLKTNLVYGLRVGYDFTKNIGAEALFDVVNTRNTQGPDHHVLYNWGAGALYHFMPDGKFVPHAGAGLRVASLSNAPNDGYDSRAAFDYGVGAKYFFNDALALRGDVRHIVILQDVRHNLEYTLGLSYYFGGGKTTAAFEPAAAPIQQVAYTPPADSDGDGVADASDKCPGTPRGEKVNSSGCIPDSDGDGVADNEDKCAGTPRGVRVDGDGCPLDSDRDGVIDNDDKCPDTPKGTRVDAKGCPLDSDGDGVLDRQDKCPGTPKGVRVDANGCAHDSDNDGVLDIDDKCPGTPKGVKVDAAGCPLDSDGDGVYDSNDKCPGTPKGVRVDAAGCPMDSDGDGVYDSNDKCPGTPKGVQVDAVGCPLDSDGDGVYDSQDKCPDTPRGMKVDAAGCTEGKPSISLNVNFDTGKSVVKSQYEDDIARVAEVMKKYPKSKVSIEGHTDNVGKAKSNQELSRARAESVRKYLVEKFGIEGSRVTATGVGSSRPLASNSTPAGREKNRRIEAVFTDL